MSRVREAMIVAGGAGRRLWPLTATTPKPLLPFCGAPLLAGMLRRLADAGVQRVLLVVGADPSPFAVLDATAGELGIEVACVPEPTPLDTAGGVRAALDEVTGPFLVLNGDIVTDVDLAAVVRAHLAARADATLVLTRVADTSSFGVCLLEGERIVGFVEKPAPGTHPGQDTVNAGTYVLEPAAIAGFPHGPLSFERTVFPRLLAEGGHLHGVVSDAPWADLGTRERFLAGHRLALDGGLDWPGVRHRGVAPPGPDVTVHHPVLLAGDARVGAGTVVGPHVVLGPGVDLGPEVRIRDSVLAEDVRVGAGTLLDGVVSGPAAIVGAGVRVPAGALLGRGARVADDTELPAGALVPGPADRPA